MKKLSIKKIQGWRIITLFVFLFGLAPSASSQVTGVITDAEFNEPVIGVNIYIRGQENSGTSSDIDGAFTLDAERGDIIVFSYLGYTTIEKTVENNRPLNVVLFEDSKLLEEVVVVGYGAVKKEDLTGVVQNVGEKDFIKGSVASPEKLLNGKVAGLQIANNGEPGGGTNIRLRGGTSISASDQPLIVIDGVPMDPGGVDGVRNPLNFVNSDDVASISILKDASAAAIYGSRGANGVIMITTKSGESGRPKISYSGKANISFFAGDTKELSPANFRAAISAKAPQEIEYLGDANTDWVSEILQNASGTDHTLSISGGTKNFKYRLSGGYLKRNGVLLTSAHEKQSIAGNFSLNLLNDDLKINYNTKTGLLKDRYAPNVMGAALAYDPTRPVLDSDSQFGGYFQWDDPLTTNNPVSSLLLTNNTNNAIRTLNNVNVTYSLPFIDGLSVTSNVAYDQITGDQTIINDPFLKDGESFSRGGFLLNRDTRNYSALIETYGTYKTRLEDLNSSVELTLGHSWQDFDKENRFEFGNGIEGTSEEDYIYTTDIKSDSILTHNRLVSFFGRANMQLNDKYLLTASLRRDGSSRFGPDNKWGLFPSFAVGWRILEEDFAQGLAEKFTSLKLRLSWGVTGNEDIGDYRFKTFYSFGTDDARYQFGDTYVNTLRGSGVDPSIRWEETSSLNLGLDFGFWNNRISGTLDVYRKYTEDLLFTVAVPGFTNLQDRILTNIGEMQNVGVELSLNTVLIDKNDFDWDVSFNIARNKNEIKRLDNSQNENPAGYEVGGISGDVGQTIQILQVGQSTQTFRTYEHIRGADGKPLPDNEDFNQDGLISNLDIYVDQNGDGLINENDLTINESGLPDVIMGLSTNVSWKKFDLSATVRTHLGNYAYNNVASGTGYFQRLTDRTTNNIHETAFQLNFNTRQLKSDYYIEDASFLKLDNVTLGYNLPDNAVFRSLRIYLTGSNLLTMTGYSGLDPELPQFTGGIDNNLYPVSRNFLIGLNANF